MLKLFFYICIDLCGEQTKTNNYRHIHIWLWVVVGHVTDHLERCVVIIAAVFGQSLAAIATGGNCRSSYSLVGVSMASQSLRNFAESAETKENTNKYTFSGK